MLEVFSEFRASSIGRDSDSAEFLRLPIKLIFEIVRISGEREKKYANIYSISTARLAGIVLSMGKSFSGDKSANPGLDQFLPYPLDSDASVFITETREIFRNLIAERKLPLPIIAALNNVISP